MPSHQAPSFHVQSLDREIPGCALLAVHDGKLDASGQRIDAVSGGVLSAALEARDLPAKAGSTLLIRTGPAEGDRVVLVSMGAVSPVSQKAYVDAARAAWRTAMSSGATRAVSHLQTVAVQTGGTAVVDDGWKVDQQIRLVREAGYRFDGFRSSKGDERSRLARVDFVVQASAVASTRKRADQADALCDAIDWCKDLANTPPNVCNPRWLADQARRMARKRELKFEALGPEQIRAAGMNALMAVAQGSDEPPRLICVQYKGAGSKAAPIVLVGKGVTFDSGGISIKPSPDMDEMKYDMCGAATVLAVVQAAADMKLPLNVVAVVPSVENMPSGGATRPGDIVETMSGQTVEILNTDAEGRLILCDALTWATRRFKASAVIDVATLTGAMIIALGHHYTGMFSNDDALADALIEAGRASVDPCWRMPVEDAYQEALRSTFADIGNIGGRAAGSVTAACFLQRFVKDVPWAHLDIAGVAWKGGATKAANGRPVGLLVQYLIDQATGPAH